MTRRITTTEAALLCEVDAATIRSWVARGHLTPNGKTGRQLTFDVAEVWKAEVETHKRDRTGRATR